MRSPRETTPQSDIDRVLGKVRGLLAKAESTTFPAEAAALTAKAQDLLSRHRLDEAAIEAGARPGSARPGSPIRQDLTVEQPYATAKYVLLAGIAAANHCEAVFERQSHTGSIVGFPADVAAVTVLYTSLLLQGTSELLAAGSVHDRAGRSRTRSFRHAFWLAFGARVAERLAEATQAVERDGQAQALPVLARRDGVVRDAVADEFGRVGTFRTTASNPAGRRAGHAAAERARLGTRPPLAGA